MDSPDEEKEAVARSQLVELVRVLHRDLSRSGLSVRERVEVRRDLAFLIGESHRHAFRPHVVVELCASVLSEVLRALPRQVRASTLASCADYLRSIEAAATEVPGQPRDRWLFVRASATRPTRGTGHLDAPLEPADGQVRPPRPRT